MAKATGAVLRGWADDERVPCHPERSEGSNGVEGDEILRYAQDDKTQVAKATGAVLRG
jgi:hypothetical protein